MPISSAIELGDLALTWSNATGDADLSIIDLDLASDRGLTTAVILSLFIDRRAEPDDIPPSGDPQDRRGWWGDEFAEVEGDLIGSRLWLLDRSTSSAETVQRAKQYVAEALAWMIEDSVVASIDVTVEVSRDRLGFEVEMQRPGRDPITFKFASRWDHMQEDA